MTELVLSEPFPLQSVARKLLNYSAMSWFVVAALGMWMFVFYVLAYYGPMLLQHGPQGLSESHLPKGFVSGDTIGNLAVMAHLVLAIVIMGGGPLQLIPKIRSRFPKFHHWLGRSYLVCAVISSVAGIYMVITRGTISGPLGDFAISLDGVLIILFSLITVRFAIARDFRKHREWALRLFLVASGVWFFRIGLMAWMVLTGGIGVDFETFTGPFLDIWGFAQYLLPLAVLEAYLRAQNCDKTSVQMIVAVGLMGSTVLTGVGVVAASMGMWLPQIT